MRCQGVHRRAGHGSAMPEDKGLAQIAVCLAERIVTHAGFRLSCPAAKPGPVYLPVALCALSSMWHIHLSRAACNPAVSAHQSARRAAGIPPRSQSACSAGRTGQKPAHCRHACTKSSMAYTAAIDVEYSDPAVVDAEDFTLARRQLTFGDKASPSLAMSISGPSSMLLASCSRALTGRKRRLPVPCSGKSAHLTRLMLNVKADIVQQLLLVNLTRLPPVTCRAIPHPA